MDHHGLLTVMRQVTAVHQSIHISRTAERPTWNWKVIPILFPESHCPFCNEIVKSEGIWFITEGYKTARLIGAIFPTPGKPVKMIQPGHPHNTGGGHLCLGKNLSGVDLFASTPNLLDCPMGIVNIPRWLKRYWSRHTCKESRDHILRCSWDTFESNRVLQELDAI